MSVAFYNQTSFAAPICETAINQIGQFGKQTSPNPLAAMIEENRLRRENIAYGLFFFFRRIFETEHNLKHPSITEEVSEDIPHQKRLKPIPELHPETWPEPEVHPSHKTSQSIRDLVKERGLGYQPFTLDSGSTPDPVLIEPKNSVLSYTDLSEVDRSVPIVILAHGFSASSYEWSDFARYMDQHSKGAVLYSNMVLGGHGRSLGAFKRSNWQEWGKPILNEYRALRAQGFTNISLAGSSTACALLLEQLSSGSYNGDIAPKNIFMIDPIVDPVVDPKDWKTRLKMRVAAVARASYPPTQAFSPEEFSRWHGYRPFSALLSLDDLTQRVTRALGVGIQLPKGTHLSVWASQGDPTVNPNGYKLIQNGIRPGVGGSVSVYPINSKFHVFTRLSGRPEAAEDQVGALTREQLVDYVKESPIPFTPNDRQLQKETFDAMLKLCRN